jgi:hypothetical protein
VQSEGSLLRQAGGNQVQVADGAEDIAMYIGDCLMVAGFNVTKYCCSECFHQPQRHTVHFSTPIIAPLVLVIPHQS